MSEVKRVLRKDEVCRAMGWSPAQLYRQIALGNFRKPLKPSPGISVWLEDDVAEKQAAAIAVRDSEAA